MNVLIFSCLCFVVAVSANVEEGGNNTTVAPDGNTAILALLSKLYGIKEEWLEVPLNHFDLFDNRTWKMRYKVNEKHYKPGGPIIIEVGGEWKIDGTYLMLGTLAELGVQENGVLVETEHRYYGESLPFGKNFSVENLKYLQIEQALEDLAYFIEHFKSSKPEYKNSKVIVHGCSYPGMLVTWMRLRFPHVVDIAYASSAPLGVGLDYPEFFEVVNDVYANISDSCVGTIKEGINETMELLTTEDGRAQVREAFKKWSCGDIDKMNSMKIVGKIVSVLNVMHDPSQYEEVACLAMSMDTDDSKAYERLAHFVALKSNHIASCKDAEDEEPDLTSIAWNYQTCTEMGTFQTLNRKNSHHPFEMDITVEESVEECVKSFGGIVTEQVLTSGIDRVTRRYGGKKPKVTKVVSIQGTHDPWKHLAHLEDYGPEAPVWVIDGSHCADVTQRDDDSPEVVEVREKVKKLITKWLKEISE